MNILFLLVLVLHTAKGEYEYQTSISGSTDIVVGERLELTCKVITPHSDTVLKVEWRSKETIIAVRSTDMVVVSQDLNQKYSIGGNMTTSTLTGQNMEPNDFTSFNCTFITTKTKLSEAIDINVVKRDFNMDSNHPKINFGVVKAWEGDRITLALPMNVMAGENVSVVEWFFSPMESTRVFRVGTFDILRKEIAMGVLFEGRFYIDFDFKSLVIRRTKTSDNGSYICTINNYKNRLQFDVVVKAVSRAEEMKSVIYQKQETCCDQQTVFVLAIIVMCLSFAVIYCIIMLSVKDHCFVGVNEQLIYK